ncbi:MAG: N-acetylglucosamine-6-phosphate deacetylase, partial [Clostridia bacterium]|nr:N-acetylglucosamine-6-phosphate deacetylase [Clostridia bacterium]
MKTLFANGFVYDTASRSFRKRDLLVERNGIITDADYHGEDIEDTVDCTGKYIIPGLIDVHTHGRGGYDFNTADEAGVLR